MKWWHLLPLFQRTAVKCCVCMWPGTSRIQRRYIDVITGNGTDGATLGVITLLVLFHMMTSSNGNTFLVTGPLCWEFTGPGEFPSQRPLTRSFDVFFDLCLNKPLSKQSWCWWFETPLRSLWRHCNDHQDGWHCLETLSYYWPLCEEKPQMTGAFTHKGSVLFRYC